MPRTVTWAAPAVVFALALGCSQETPSKKAAAAPAPKAESADLAATQVTLHVDGMVWAVGWGARAKQAIANLPWADPDHVEVDVGTQEVRFLVPDMSRFDEQELKDAFKKREFDKVDVLRKAKK